jgi:hypothetical protein
MKTPKQKRQMAILGVLGLVLMTSLYYAIRTSNSGLPSSLPKLAAGSGPVLQGLVIEHSRARGKKSISLVGVDPKIHLERLVGFSPGIPLNARNMFAFESAPPLTEGKSKAGKGHRPGGPSEEVKGGTPPPFATPLGPPPPPPVVINLKFYGVKVNLATKKRQGFFADGDAMYLAGEGDLVGNRYRILKVAEAFAEIEEVSSKVHRQLPMVTQ